LLRKKKPPAPLASLDYQIAIWHYWYIGTIRYERNGEIMSFDWNNPKDLDSLFNSERIDEIVANPDEPQNAEVLRIINKMSSTDEEVVIGYFVEDEN